MHYMAYALVRSFVSVKAHPSSKQIAFLIRGVINNSTGNPFEQEQIIRPKLALMHDSKGPVESCMFFFFLK